MLADWRRQVHELYAAVRTLPPLQGWNLWRDTRRRLFLEHPQSPLPAAGRDELHLPAYFDYDPSWRRFATVSPAPRERMLLPGSASPSVEGERFALARVDGMPSLSLYRLLDYAGGIFLSFRDAGAGVDTYGGGRYLLDTAKGADLGCEGDSLVLDFNFAYQPSCSYDAAWNCPLPPPANHVDVAVRAGERLAAG